MKRATVFGAKGFLGRHLLPALREAGYDATGLGREGWPPRGSDLGDVIYAIGMNANFRGRPFETYDAHIGTLETVLKGYQWSSITYISSTRVYLGCASTREDSSLVVAPLQPDQIYNLSKLAGEALCLAQHDRRVHIARLSNLYGADDRSDVFLTAVMREAIETGGVLFRTAPNSSKDYLHVADAAAAVVKIMHGGDQRIVNVASGQNTSNESIAAMLTGMGVQPRFAKDAPEISFPTIDTAALHRLGVAPLHLDRRFAETYRAMACALETVPFLNAPKAVP